MVMLHLLVKVLLQKHLTMQVHGFHTGGSIHIISNNMIGFTTEHYDSRSTCYSSDVAKGYEVPVIHVNADNPEAVVASSAICI